MNNFKFKNEIFQPGTSALFPNIAAAYNPYATYALNAATLYPGLLSASTDQYGMVRLTNF